MSKDHNPNPKKQPSPIPIREEMKGDHPTSSKWNDLPQNLKRIHLLVNDAENIIWETK
jgi:hypothetical protein